MCTSFIMVFLGLFLLYRFTSAPALTGLLLTGMLFAALGAYRTWLILSRKGRRRTSALR
jgi:hypothetical protein